MRMFRGKTERSDGRIIKIEYDMDGYSMGSC